MLSTDDEFRNRIDLSPMGFRMGRCELVYISGELTDMEIFYLPDHGIHKIQVTDETGIKQELGPPFTANIDPNIKRTAIEF